MEAPISSLRGAVIAIAGAGSGIGRGAAVHLASLGAHLSLADVSFEAVERHAAEIRASGGQCLASRCDVRDAAAINNWIDSTVQAFGNLDGAVNCAGVFRKGLEGAPIMEKSDEEWDFVIDINLTGMFRCLRAELSHINPGGSVVNLTSTVGMIGLPMDSPYCVSKHGIIGLTRTAAKEMSDKNVRINCIAPAAIETPMLGPNTGRTREMLLAEVKGHTPLARLGTVQEVAKTIAFLLSSDSSFTTGAVYTVDGGMTC